MRNPLASLLAAAGLIYGASVAIDSVKTTSNGVIEQLNQLIPKNNSEYYKPTDKIIRRFGTVGIIEISLTHDGKIIKSAFIRDNNHNEYSIDGEGGVKRSSDGIDNSSEILAEEYTTAVRSILAREIQNKPLPHPQ